MKTHDIAKNLNSLITDNCAPNLKSAISEASGLLMRSPNMESVDAKLLKKTDQIAVSLQALISLSKYSKQQWISVIEEFNLPIVLNPRASSRDVVGKVLSYLEANPSVLKTPKRTREKSNTTNTTNLQDTLNKLINYEP